MKLKHLAVSLVLVIILNTCCFQRAAVGMGAPRQCILLLEGTEAFLSRHGDGLHALIDLLPTHRELGLVVTGQSTQVLEPVPLSRVRRAELHAYIEQCYPAALEVEPPEWEAMLDSSIHLLAQQGKVNSTIVLLRAGTSLPANWQQKVQWAAEQGVRLYELDLNTTWSSMSEPDHRLPHAVASGAFGSLFELLGLTSAPLTSLAFNDKGMQLALTVSAEVESLMLQWDRSATHSLLLTSPTGQLVDPLAEELEGQLFEGPSYTCLHLTPDLLPAVSDWQGQWVISASSPIGITAWFDDPAWLHVWVRETPGGQRLISLTTNLSGESLPTQVVLADLRGNTLVQLNDLGLNGDTAADDGVYSALLPSFVAAGPALVRLSGNNERSILVNIPPVAVETSLIQTRSTETNDVIEKLLLVALVLTVSGIAMMPGSKKKPLVWRITHQRVDGHWHCHDFTKSPIIAGSAPNCLIRLARSAAGEQLRIRSTKEGRLSLDVLASEPPVCVNDRQVYLSKVLEHGDQITIGGDTLFVEKLEYLRAGKHNAGQGNGGSTKK